LHPRHDWPDRFHVIASAGVNAIVKIHGRVAMRRDEFDPVAELGFPCAAVQVDIAELVAPPTIAGAGKVGGLRAIVAIGGKSFQARVYGDEPFVIGADDGGEDGQRVTEVRSDAPVVEIHEDVGAGLQFSDFGQREVDVPGAGASSGKDFDRQACVLHRRLRRYRPGKCVL